MASRRWSSSASVPRAAIVWASALSVLALFGTASAAVSPSATDGGVGDGGSSGGGSGIGDDLRSRVHAFYYLWYGTPKREGKWQHWDHEVLPHWRPMVNRNYPTVGTRHKPPHDIHAPFYPAKGCYSSSDKAVIRQHLQEMDDAGIGVAVLSWWGQQRRIGTSDTQGVQTDQLLPLLFEVAENSSSNVKLAFHLEPYKDRSAASVRSDVLYLLERFGDSPALFRWTGPGPRNGRPVFYVYDSYHIVADEWATVLSPEGAITLRGTPHDALFVGLWLHSGDLRALRRSWFDAAYPYFAADGTTYGSTRSHWPSISLKLHQSGMLFFASVGPGYNDTLIRPWNFDALRERRGVTSYQGAWAAAMAAAPDVVSITSFNEWGEGTQIEPAQPQVRPNGARYLDYGPDGPRAYLDETRSLVSKWLTDHGGPYSGPMGTIGESEGANRGDHTEL